MKITYEEMADCFVLRDYYKVKVKDIAAKFDVGETTMRRYFRNAETMGKSFFKGSW